MLLLRFMQWTTTSHIVNPIICLQTVQGLMQIQHKHFLKAVLDLPAGHLRSRLHLVLPWLPRQTGVDSHVWSSYQLQVDHKTGRFPPLGTRCSFFAKSLC